LQKRVRLSEICDKIDRAIVYFADGVWLDQWKIQKAIFYFLWIDSLHYNYDFFEAAKKIAINPDKQGMYSQLIVGSEETLVKDGYLKVKDSSDKKYEVTSSDKGKDEILSGISESERVYLKEIKEILLKLNSKEFMFFVYYNPYINEKIKSYFLSESLMKEQFVQNKDLYLNKLKREGIIDEKGVSLINKKILLEQ
jgi:hypothetical protein